MRASNLPSLRGAISTSHPLRITVARAISELEILARRNGLGYAAAALDLQTFLEAAKDALSPTTRAASQVTLPATVTVATGDRRRTVTSVTATHPDGNTTVPFQSSTASVTLSGLPANLDTVTVNGRVYTFQTVLTNVSGNVLIGANATATALNLSNAINGGAGSGSTYAAATVLHPNVYAVPTAGVVALTAYGVNPASANSFTLSASGASAVVSGATFSGGVFNSGVTFAVDLPADATVDQYGTITWVSAGTPTVTVTFHGRTDTIAVTAS